MPNIIYIYADDLGYGEIGPYGQTKIQTPNLDKLAAEGIKFTRHYTGAPVCSPARSSLLTGLHTGHAVIRGNHEFGTHADAREGGQMPLPPHTVTIGTVLQNAGYATACVGKWGLGMAQTSGHPNRQGFDYFFGYLDQKQAQNYYPTHLWENDQPFPLYNNYRNIHAAKKQPGSKPASAYQQGDHAADHISSKALTFIAEHKEKPFFLYYTPTMPHLALQPKQEYLEKYLGKFPDYKPYDGSQGYAPHDHPRAAYAAMISMLDADVGKIMSSLRELGIDDNTIVMFSSDNGPTTDIGGVDTQFFNSTAGLRGRKRDLYEGGIRMPMLARWPGHIKPGMITDHVSAQYDVLPTIAELLDLELEPPYDGISFLPTLLGKPAEQKQHDYLYWELNEKGGSVAVTRWPWKAIRTGVVENINAPWQLYNLESDPEEKSDVAGQHPDIIKELDAAAKEAHWHPANREFEFIDPKFGPKE